MLKIERVYTGMWQVIRIDGPYVRLKVCAECPTLEAAKAAMVLLEAKRGNDGLIGEANPTQHERG